MILLWTGVKAVWDGKPRASGDDPSSDMLRIASIT